MHVARTETKRMTRRQLVKGLSLTTATTGLAGCAGADGDKSAESSDNSREATADSDSLVVGSRTFPEQVTLGYIAYFLLRENTDNEIIDRTGYGGTSDMSEVYQSDSPGFDLYYEYMGTAWAAQPPLNENQITDPDELYSALSDQLQDTPVTITGRTSWENTWAPFGRESVLSEYGLSTLTDLAEYVNAGNYDLTFALESSFFGRADGFEALVDHYGFESKHLAGWKQEGGLFRLGSAPVVGTAVDQRKVDLGLGYSTSAWITDVEGEIRTLNDDQGFWPAFHLVGVVREEVASDTVLTELNRLSEVIPDGATMRELNQRAAETDSRTAAREHLKSNDFM